MSDPILSAMLAELGCPFAEGTPESVVWLHGYASGFAELARIALPGDLSPPDWRSSAERRAKAN